MQRIAVISDIHANPYALEAVVDDLGRAGVDEVLLGGDLVGRGPLG
ncbi:MAG: metallophosphoesterase family protein, partial [Persicimonas sp.]